MKTPWLPFPFFSALEISGPDRAPFLHGQLTADIHTLAPHQRTWAASCNTQGRMESLGILENQGDRFYFYVPTSIARSTWVKLQFFAKFSKVTISLGTLPIAIKLDADFTSHLTPEFMQDPTAHQASPDLQNQILHQWIQHQIPWLTPDTLKRFIPQELGLERLGALSFDKGCYLGQEIIARLHYKGSLKTHMVSFEYPIAQIPKALGEVVCSIEMGGRVYGLALRPKAANPHAI